MLVAQKANKVIDIDDYRMDEYVQMGYTVRTTEGSVLSEPMTEDKLKHELENAEERIKKLEAEISALKKAKKTSGAKKEEA